MAKTQSYVIGKNGKSVTVPLGAVQQLPESLQSLIFVSIFIALAVCTYLNVTLVGPALAAAAPAVHAWLLWARVPLCSALFSAVGVAHFTAHEGIASMYPKPGAWGLWHLPGSASFHTNWTGVAEVAGALGLALGAAAIPALQALYPQLQAVSAAGLFLLTIAVSPANVYMFTHNAPGPVGSVVPWPLHVLRFYMQVALLTAFWDMGRGVLLGHVPLLP
ncbi:hypothetical protein HYH02_003666 [Chlamydomonas schloesseri]|uniref:Uncharacterized protein n=1 Tax=Chlamydomonas schloesseri TaxID=2026947 RepID=A0A835WS77_9CHLO|nr:hypothetical protein HYH02_003666 [Chlamydomonas schloesseri]|eukprot:KAG2451891.1 hypothetical protein HYH02_003666 [Chlamydomonas schloesseri]